MTRQLIFSITAMMALLWLLAVGLGTVVMNDELNETFDGALQDTAERLVPLIVGEFEHYGPQEALPRLQTSRASGYREYLIYQVRDSSGRLLIRSHDAPDKPFETPLKRGFWKDSKYQYFTAFDAPTGIYVQVADKFRNRDEAVREGAVALFVPLALLIPVSGIAIWLLVRRTVQPIGDLRRDIESKDGGNMEPIDATALPRELQPIALSVNLLMTRLRTALDAEREFTSNSAHELRTPIAGALAQTQMLIAELGNDANRQRAGQIETSLRRLSHLAEKLLQLSRAEAGIGMADRQTELTGVVDMVVTDFQRSIAAPDRLILHRNAGTRLAGPYSEDAFAIVLRNLIENALVHGDPRKNPVEVFVEDGGMVRIVNGSPILTESELIAIRKRFSRGKTEAAGSGLGLSIVDRLLGQMNARLVLLSPATGRDNGFEARIHFPNLSS
ncbi:histidine kinase dimerization/phospho-acceptor domain-containing protein [Rhizobium sp. NFR07]|uniref:sensor histidine kinase n=1 Tax=Rhizobium sp. NFR07 TaxID=1566262 RepID=UPI000B837712|nr:histidine kinase dimerization/phospho-acceptor domain-containing protein [Rhizobium sp. NFR07]